MERYQRKPLIVDVVEWKGTNFDEVDALALKYGLDDYVSRSRRGFSVRSSSSGRVWVADIGDRVIVTPGPPAEIFLSREELFHKNYEPYEGGAHWPHEIKGEEG